MISLQISHDNQFSTVVTYLIMYMLFGGHITIVHSLSLNVVKMLYRLQHSLANQASVRSYN